MDDEKDRIGEGMKRKKESEVVRISDGSKNILICKYVN